MRVGGTIVWSSTLDLSSVRGIQQMQCRRKNSCKGWRRRCHVPLLLGILDHLNEFYSRYNKCLSFIIENIHNNSQFVQTISMRCKMFLGFFTGFLNRILVNLHSSPRLITLQMSKSYPSDTEFHTSIKLTKFQEQVLCLVFILS